MSYFICGSKPLSELTRIYFGEEYHDDDNINNIRIHFNSNVLEKLIDINIRLQVKCQSEKKVSFLSF